MCRRQQFAERLSPHHIGTGWRIQPVSRVGLAALELQHGQRAAKTLDMCGHPAVEPRLIKAMTLLDRPRAGKFLVLPDALGHAGAPLIFPQAPSSTVTSS